MVHWKNHTPRMFTRLQDLQCCSNRSRTSLCATEDVGAMLHCSGAEDTDAPTSSTCMQTLSTNLDDSSPSARRPTFRTQRLKLPRPQRCSIADLNQSSPLPKPSAEDVRRRAETPSSDAHLSGTPTSMIPAHAGTNLNPSPICGHLTPNQSLATCSTPAMHRRSMSPSLERSPREYSGPGAYANTCASTQVPAEATHIAFSSQSSDASSTQALAMLAEYMEKPRTFDSRIHGVRTSSSPYTTVGSLSKADSSPRRQLRPQNHHPPPHSNLVLPRHPSEPSQSSSLDFLSFPFSLLRPDDPLTSIQVRAPASDFMPLPSASVEYEPITRTHSDLSVETEHALPSSSDESSTEWVPSPRDTDSVHSQHSPLPHEQWNHVLPGAMTPLTSSPSSGGGRCSCCDVCCVQTAFTEEPAACRVSSRKRRQQMVVGELRRMRPRSSSSSSGDCSSTSCLSGGVFKDQGVGNAPYMVEGSVPVRSIHDMQMRTHGDYQECPSDGNKPSALESLQQNLMLGAHEHEHVVPVHMYLPRIKAPVCANESSNESLSGDSVASSSPARLHAFLRSLICAPDVDPTSYPSPGRVHPWNLDSNLSPRRSALHQLAGPSAKPSFQCSAACGASNISKSDFQLDSSTSVPTSASQVLPLTAAADGCSRLSDASQPQGAVYVYCA